MKKTIILVIALILILTMTVACSNKEANDDGIKEDTTVTGNNEEVTDDTGEKEETPDQSDDVTPDTVAPDDTGENGTTDGEMFDIALALVDHPVSELYAAIGEPADKSYASSCMGSGQDGELYYDGFIVCTYLEGERETVVDVYK